jgi:hypothetical protein
MRRLANKLRKLRKKKRPMNRVGKRTRANSSTSGSLWLRMKHS